MSTPSPERVAAGPRSLNDVASARPRPEPIDVAVWRKAMEGVPSEFTAKDRGYGCQIEPSVAWLGESSEHTRGTTRTIAAWVARCSPAGVSALLYEIERLQALENPPVGLADANYALSLSEAREALKPFAKACDALDRLPDIRPNGIEDEGYNVPAAAWSDDMPVSVSLGALRRARKALENGPAGLADATNDPADLSSLRKGAEDARLDIATRALNRIASRQESHPVSAAFAAMTEIRALVSGSEDGADA